MPMQLSISQLNLYFEGKKKKKNIALEAYSGHILALIGPKGAGKTTLLRVVNRMVELQGAQLSGNITLDGGSIFMKEPHWLRTQVGMVLPTPVIFPGTVYDNICAGLRLHGLRSRNKLMERVEKVLKELGIYREYYPMLEIRASSLPMPQQQLICICRALAMEPGLLLMDEATRVLDSVSVLRLEEALGTVKKHCTIVLATNALQQAGRLADETALLMDGEVVEWGRTDELLAHPKQERTEQYITGRYL